MMKRVDGINVVPLIDIMLVLLAIVLTTASFIHYGRIEVDLPESQAASSGDVSDAVVIVVDRAGSLFLDEAPVGMAAIGARLDRLQPGDAVVLKVDREASFGDFAAVVDEIKLRELNRLSILVNGRQ
jgi:biopolymer transport protein ExbD